MDNETAIEIKNIQKSFKVYYDKGQSLKERLIFKRRNHYENRMVLKDISLTVKKGEAIGLVGHNGCGKSTLLKMMTRIMYPDKGTIEISGRVSSLIELGAGFHPDMSGKENIYINASIFGLSKREIDRRVDEIIDFSELRDFIDNPVRTYSSGMYMRLAFAVAINVDAEVLLIDEILGVGDANFQIKCFEKIKQLKQSGVTIAIVSHSLGQIEQICDESYWIEDGYIVESGIPKYVHEKYLSAMEKVRISNVEKSHEKEVAERAQNTAEAEEEATAPSEAPSANTPPQPKVLPSFCDETAIRMGNGDVQFVDAKMLNAQKNVQYVFQTGEDVVIYVKYESQKPGIKANFGYGIFRDDGVHCYGTNVMIEYDSLVDIKESGEMFITFKNMLLPGKYFLDIAVHSAEGVFMDDIRRIQSFVVSSDKRDIGVCRLKSSWQIQ